MTTTKTEYGTYEHGKPHYTGLSWRRADRWIADKDPKPDTFDSLFAAGRDDDSPIYQGKYNGKCSCCWLGYAHTEASHKQRLT